MGYLAESLETSAENTQNGNLEARATAIE